MYFVILTELGIAISQDGKHVRSFPFSQPASDFVTVKNAQYNLRDIIEFLSKAQSPLMVNDEALLKALKKESLDVQMMEQKQIEQIQATKPQILIDAEFAKNQQDAMTKLRDFALQLSSAKVTEISQSPDLHIIQAIKALDEIDVMINGLSSRLREWYGLHFPELDNIIDSINGYAQIVMAGKRQDLSKTVYEDAGFPDSKIEMLSVIQDKSKGGDISKENLVIVQSIAKQILEMAEIRRAMESHIESEMKSVAPNLSAILGAAVGARILSKAGSLKKLATMPASTIQILGAEKALFRALKTGTEPPKHGILFQHPIVHAAPRWQRGKMARAIASKAAIASRVDVYGGGLNQTLLEKLNVRVNEIGEKYKEPTQRAPPQRREERRERFGERRRQDRFREGQREGRFGDRRRDGTRSGSTRREFRADIKKRKKFGKRR
ncbi:NOP5/NOP56 family protein [Candidatus Nitrosotenuis uzonensis]|uniref:Putative pre-mRNA processing ribonucleoprotein, binding domain protein n=1 Tax=Candidatus Nitrosotenuis uzonensis TaxID=1407055 RepID=A0A812EW94_9ARCH|nr:ribonucleotide-diphosphate reductase subunit beta [Candidatus Nitrosotenuis uzonensis]CAE6495667.1 putative pre-mRNA processing ribonucleoprotein, binding domain protein [Candidatus Nitrosotenuis uzonensis]